MAAVSSSDAPAVDPKPQHPWPGANSDPAKWPKAPAEWYEGEGHQRRKVSTRDGKTLHIQWDGRNFYQGPDHGLKTWEESLQQMNQPAEGKPLPQSAAMKKKMFNGDDCSRKSTSSVWPSTEIDRQLER